LAAPFCTTHIGPVAGWVWSHMKKPLSVVLLGALVLTVSGCDKAASRATTLERAEAAIAKGDANAAIIDLKTVLQVSPDLATARLLLGRALLEQGDARSAEVELRRAAKLGISADSASSLIAKAMMRQGKYKKLLDEFAAIEPKDVKDWVALKALVAEATGYVGRPEDARRLIDQVLAKSGDDVPALLVKARLAATPENADTGLELIKRALTIQPANLDAWRLQADLQLYAKRDTKAAVASYLRLVELAPQRVDSRVSLITAYLIDGNLDQVKASLEGLRKVAPNDLQTRFFDAQMAYTQGNYIKARDYAQQLLKLAPDQPRLLVLAGASELGLGSLIQAEALLSKALFVSRDMVVARRLLATVTLRMGRTKKALELLQPILDSPSVDSESLNLAAECYLTDGQFGKAEVLFGRALQLRPSDERTRTALAVVHLRKGDADRAFAELTDVAAGTAQTHADLALITARIQRGEYDNALAAIAKLKLKDAKSALPFVLESRIHGLNGNAAAQRASFEAALQREPANFPAVLGLTLLDLRADKFDAARQRMEAHVRLVPKEDSGWIALAGLYAGRENARNDISQIFQRGIAEVPGSAELRVLLIDHHLKGRNAREALTVAEAAAAAFPTRVDVIDVLGRAQLASGQTNQALKTFNTLASLQPNSPQPLLRQVDVHYAQGDVAAAFRAAVRAYELAPSSVVAVATLVSLATQSNNADKAERVIRDLRNKFGDSAWPFVFEGDLRIAQKKPDAALAAFQLALGKKDPSAAGIRYHATLLNVGKANEAQKFAEDWVRRQPKDGAFQKHLGDRALLGKNYAEAERLFSKSLVLAPGDAITMNNLAWALLKQQKPQALDYAKKAVAQAPDEAAFSDTYASTLLAAGKAKEAEAIWRRLVAENPSRAAYRFGLARAQLAVGDKVGAQDNLAQLAKLGAKFTEQAEVQALIAQSK